MFESVFDYSIFICFHHQFYWQFEVKFFNVIVFYIVLSYSLQKVTYDKCVKYKLKIHKIGTHDSVL